MYYNWSRQSRTQLPNFLYILLIVVCRTTMWSTGRFCSEPKFVQTFLCHEKDAIERRQKCDITQKLCVCRHQQYLVNRIFLWVIILFWLFQRILWRTVLGVYYRWRSVIYLAHRYLITSGCDRILSLNTTEFIAYLCVIRNPFICQ